MDKLFDAALTVYDLAGELPPPVADDVPGSPTQLQTSWAAVVRLILVSAAQPTPLDLLSSFIWLNVGHVSDRDDP